MKRAIVTDSGYAALADFRFMLRQFAAFSEEQARDAGLTPQQHQALLVIRGAARPVTVGYIGERLIIRPHSASGLLVRLESLGLVDRQHPAADRRQTLVSLTPDALALLERLSATHRSQLRRLRPLLTELLAVLD